MKFNSILVSFILISFMVINAASAQEKKDDRALAAAALKNLADSKNFAFKPIYANLTSSGISITDSFVNSTPGAGTGHIFITGDYRVTLKPDSLVSFLPFFGNNQLQDKPSTSAYQTVTLADNPSKFSALKYNYVVKQRKSGAVQITITPTDNKAIEKFVFEFFPDKAVKLTLTIDNVESISYNGELIQQ